MLGRLSGLAARSVVVPLLALPIAACLYIPPVWDINDPINSIEGIRIGQTTRNDILTMLGNSPRVCDGATVQTSEWYHYTGTASAGAVAYYAGDKKGDRETLGEMPWHLNVYFDQNQVVEAIDTNPPPSLRPQASGLSFEPSAGAASTAPVPDVFRDRSSCFRS